jgi:hypothetical protein
VEALKWYQNDEMQKCSIYLLFSSYRSRTLLKSYNELGNGSKKKLSTYLVQRKQRKYLLQLPFQLSLCIPPMGRLEPSIGISTVNVAARLRTVVESTLVDLLLQWQVQGLVAGQLLSPVAEVTRRSSSHWQLSGEVAAWARATAGWLV